MKFLRGILESVGSAFLIVAIIGLTGIAINHADGEARAERDKEIAIARADCSAKFANESDATEECVGVAKAGLLGRDIALARIMMNFAR